MKWLSKKGFTLGQMVPVAIMFVVIAIVISLGATVLAGMQDTQTADSVAFNTTGAGLDSLSTFGDYLPTIALVVVISLIIGIISVYLMNRQ